MADTIKSSGTRILLIRHGETEWNRIRRFQGRSNVPLNPKGREQGRALALGLKDEPITAIYSSPLTRARQTASLIKVFHPSISLFEEPGLIEMDLGQFEGMDAADWPLQDAEFRKAWQENPASVTMPGGESLFDVQGRAVRALNQIADLHPPGSTLLVCSHNFVNLSLLCYALEIPLDRFRELRQETGTLNILQMEGRRLRAEVVNQSRHLKEL
jgi:probable phosphoglycerate mutase